MRDYIKRLLITGIIALCISLLFLGGKHSHANSVDIKEMTAHWIWPADGIITDTFGTRRGHHKGIDIAAAYGTPIYTVDDGIVTKSYYSYSYGHVIFVKHQNNIETVYAHLKQRNVVEGQKIKQGEKIGEMGSTGDSSGVHLHFEVHQNEWTVNKENAFNPVLALNKVTIGETVQALKRDPSTKEVLEAVAEMHENDEQEHPRFERGHVDYNNFNTGYTAYNDRTDIRNVKNEANKDNKVVHIVKYGESLWSISKMYQTSVESIQTMNELINEKILPNQKLIITDVPKTVYIVKTGDTLSSISEKLDISIEKLIEENQLTSDVIHPQQVLKLKK